jgi:hypothetical protein
LRVVRSVPVSSVQGKSPRVVTPTGSLEHYPRQRPTLPRTFARSTIGGSRLNFRVRNGNGCDPAPMTTGKLEIEGLSDWVLTLQTSVNHSLANSLNHSMYEAWGPAGEWRLASRETRPADRPRASCQRPLTCGGAETWDWGMVITPAFPHSCIPTFPDFRIPRNGDSCLTTHPQRVCEWSSLTAD